jgi:hypothetical protein
MHIEILTEDSSGKALLELLVPKLIGPYGQPHSWRLHAYRGVGRIPAGLSTVSRAARRILLDQLPRLLRGYAKTPGIDAVIVVLDSDDRPCADFLLELTSLAESVSPGRMVMFRLAIEEIEAWYLGDRSALLQAYPRTRLKVLDGYAQDSICGTWELLADAVHPGGRRAIHAAAWPLPGQVKHEWATRIGPRMNPDANTSASFGKFRDGLRRLITPPDPAASEGTL